MELSLVKRIVHGRNAARAEIVGVRFARAASRRKSLKPVGRIGGPAVLSVTAAVLTFLLRPVTTHSRGYTRRRENTRTHARPYDPAYTRALAWYI